MLRNILCKLPVLTTISDVPASPYNVSLLRSLSPTTHECRRNTKKNSSRPYSKYIHRRSNSFPSANPKTSQSERLVQQRTWKEPFSQGSNSSKLVNRRDLHQKIDASFRKEHSEIERRNEIQKTKVKGTVPEPATEDKKYYDNYEVTEQYELEASKPRRSQSELVFNVFEYMEKLESDYDPINYLQPNNLRPFGSMDNVYYPNMMGSKEPNVMRYPQTYNAEETELSSTVKKTKTKDDLQQREYSTNTKTFHSKPQGPVDLIDNLPPFDESGHYVNVKPKPNHNAKKPVPVKYFVNKPKPNKEVEEALGVAEECKKKLIKSKYNSEEESKKNVHESHKLPWCEDFLTKEEHTETLIKHTISNKPTVKVATPWLSYSDTLKNQSPKDDYPLELDVDTEIKSPLRQMNTKPSSPQKRSLNIETYQPSDSNNNHENILQRQNTAGTFQKRNLATEPVSKINIAKNTKSNLHVSVVSTMLPMKKKFVREKTFVKSNHYAKTARPLEPKSCEKPLQKKKCFLPSKVRLKPPVCTPKPPPCPIKEPCERSDDCLRIKPKKLPVLETSNCPCVEDVVPEINPKMKRLCLKFPDPPRVCPPPPSCGPRADDNLVAKPKKLVMLKPSDCVCVEPPPMTDIKFKRLQKICVPEEKCYPKTECPQPPPCVRADDKVIICEKPLPQLKAGYCPCVEPEVPDKNPKMRRLKFTFKDPPKPKSCEPINPCPPRADDRMPEKHKKLPIFKPSDCVCIEPPPMVNVPLKRLEKTCVPEVKCYPKKECPKPEPCIRADDCWELKIKPLPVIKDGPCICIDPFVPDKIPKLKKLDVECGDQPRPRTCQPVNPCPPRADESIKPKIKKLPLIEMGDCKCIEAPDMTDVPLKRLQKVCEPEEKCYPKKECPAPEPCLRADDTLCSRKKRLPILEAKECPCVESPPLKEAPALKRLELKVCEPPKICPKPKVCDEVPRADDHWKGKAKKLPKLKPGDCPCVDPPMVEAPCLKRLVCKDDPEDCFEEDPCIDTPRADMGCWEYYNSEEQKCNNTKKSKKGVSYNSKRRYNTDSRVNLFDEVKNAVRNREIERNGTAVETGRLNEVTKKEGLGVVKLLNSNSTPTFALLNDLRELEKETPSRLAFETKKQYIGKMSEKYPYRQDYDCGTSVRKLSTVVPNMPQDPIRKKKCLDIKMPCDKKKKQPTCHKIGSPCSLTKLKCASTKCPVNCEKERTPICCEKKTSPYPAFSELAEEELEPFSETTQYTCSRKDYGFHPRYKRLNDPLSKDNNKKKYSTLVANEEARDSNLSNKVYIPRLHSANNDLRLETNANLESSVAPGDIKCTSPIRKIAPLVNKLSYFPLEQKFCQLLKQKANYGIIGIDTTIPRISSYGTSTILSRSQIEPGLSRNIYVYMGKSQSLSTSLFRYKSTSTEKNKKCKPKKKKCPKFKMENCPEPTVRPACKRKRPVYVCVKEKSRAPYPAFTDCLDEELAENLAECPLQRDKIRQMQPSCMDPLDRPKLTKPVEPVVGKVDPLKEHECVKARLAIDNQGLSQSCHDFGRFQKVMRAKDYLKEVNRDCTEIERMRKLGKWPPKNSRGLCSASVDLFSFQKRGMCGYLRYPNAKHSQAQEEVIEEKPNLKLKPKTGSLKFNACPKSIYIRKYHVLCIKPEKKVVDNFDIKMNEVSQHQLTEDDSCKFMKLRNVQWRINNFQKWHRLQRMISTPDCPKKYSRTSTGVKKLAFLGQSQKTFSTSATKLVSLPEPLEAFVHRGISTTYILSRAEDDKNGIFGLKGKCPKGSKSCPKLSLPNCSKKKRKTCEWKYTGRHCKKLDSPYPAFSECRDYDISPKICECPVLKEQIQQLQPQYPILPEISSGFLPELPPQQKVDVNIEEEYVRHKYGLEKEGVTLDCSTFGLKRKPLSCKIAKQKYENVSEPAEDECKQQCTEEIVEVKEVPSCSAHTEWCRSDKMNGTPPRRTLVDDCRKPYPEFSKPEVSTQQVVKKCDPKVEAPTEDSNEYEETAKPTEANDVNNRPKMNPCLCKLKPPCEKKDLTLWQRIVNYFKARPNCPAPDDWKKKAAREKAEKYAKAAGLVVCDPKQLPKKGSCCVEELPKVITPKCPKFPYRNEADKGRRSFSTTCMVQDKRVRNLNLIARSQSSVCHRWYSTGPPMGDEDRDSLDGEENMTCKKDTTAGSERRHFSTMRNADTLEDATKNLDGAAIPCEHSEIDSNVGFNAYIEPDESDILDEEIIRNFGINDMNSNDGMLIDTSESLNTVLYPGNDVADAYDGIEENLVDETFLNEVDDCTLGNKDNVRKWSTEGSGQTGRRYYSRNVNWRNLEDINKSLEEEEKKRLVKKILKPYLEGATREHESEDDCDDNIQRNLEQNQEDITSRNVVETENETASFSRHVSQRKLSFFDVIFHEPMNDTMGYNQARAFAAFQEFFHKIEVFSDVNYEEVEKNKTKKMVQQLDELMIDKNQNKED
ncbi:unnamed protein product [Phaedon cochleariae]|uniref:Titin-like n=1 Tax=Phaedon cochleariae TaxID=80249 RepID=A0A9P0DJ31_PHACE|nr:unnamed protein product [Phaedon cochleariae]